MLGIPNLGFAATNRRDTSEEVYPETADIGCYHHIGWRHPQQCAVSGALGDDVVELSKYDPNTCLV